MYAQLDDSFEPSYHLTSRPLYPVLPVPLGNVFLISEPIDDQAATIGNGSTIGFAVKSPEQGDEWHEAGLNNGGTTCEDPPGMREGMGMKLYLAYLRDPSGNKLCGILNLS